MESDADVWGANEVGAVLDRVTARVVVFNIAKVVRPLGKILMAATTHTDLIDELAPNLTITRWFHEEVSCERILFYQICLKSTQMIVHARLTLLIYWSIIE